MGSILVRSDLEHAWQRLRRDLLVFALVSFAAAGVAYLLVGSEGQAWSWSDLAVVSVLSLPIFALLFPLVWGLYHGLNISAAPAIARERRRTSWW